MPHCYTTQISEPWAMEFYSLENEIRSFFDGNPCTSRKECDDLARSLLGGETVVPFPIQGQFSYTVYSPQAVTEVPPGRNGSNHPVENDKIVQFRLDKSKIDIYVAQLAKAIHGDITAETDYFGEIGCGAGACLSVYVIQKLPGITYVEMGNFSVEMSPEMASKQLRLVEDLARYFATSWLHPQLVTQDQRESLRATMSHKLSLLTSTLPSRFYPTISRVHKELGELFQSHYPQILTHGDLNPLNMLISPTSGRITGIIDWAEAGVLPFGLALYALENLLGNMNCRGWEYFKIKDQLEQKFWNRFWDCIADARGLPDDKIRHAVTIARQVGVLMQYGFKWENRTVERAVTENDASSLAYLDGLLLNNERRYKSDMENQDTLCTGLGVPTSV